MDNKKYGNRKAKKQRQIAAPKTKNKKNSKRNDISKKAKVLNIIGWILSALQLVTSTAVVVLVIKLGVLSTLYNVLVIVGLVILLALTRFLLWRSKPLAKWIIGAVISVLITAVCCFGSYYLYNALHALDNITTDDEYVTVGVYVLDKDSAQTIVDAKDYKFGYADLDGGDTMEKTIVEINKDIANQDDSAKEDSYNITTDDKGDMFSLADGLLKNQDGAIIMDESFVEVIAEEDGYTNFATDIREIASYKIAKKVDNSSRRDVFNVYLSGIDTTGKISNRSRSDVNVIASVNRNTHQILLVSTPRDYYIPLSISKGVNDKLTHAGLYGVQCSMDTLKMLYDQPMDYYFRINFTGFEKVINALGGIDVESPISFTASNGGYSISKGMNHLNGEEALGFARERYAFGDGDNQRGRDHMTVIKAVAAKAMSPAILNNFSGLMQGLEGSFQTNIPEDLISEIVADQLSSNPAWDIQTYSVEGTGASKKTYSMPNTNAYVCIPNQATVDKAKEYMSKVNNNEVITVEETAN